MNRIDSEPDCSLLVPAQASVSAAKMSGGAGSDAGTTFFVPLHYERNYAYPLIVWLHGSEDSEQQLKRVMPLVSMRNHVAVAPRGTVEHAPTPDRGLCWSWSQAEEHIQRAQDRVGRAIAEARQKYHIAAKRVFVAGFGSGGTMALRLAMAHPTHFAGAISLGGSFPTGRNPLARLTEARRVPVAIACAEESVHYPSTQVCDDLRLLHSAGLDITLRVYPGGDTLSPRMLSDLDRWVMEQILGGKEQAVSA